MYTHPKKNFLFLLLIVSLQGIGQQSAVLDSAQSLISNRKMLTIRFSMFNHSVSTPFHRILNKRLHPGVMAGIELPYKETGRSKIYQTFNTGIFYNRYNGTGIMVTTDAGYRYLSKFRMVADVSIGLGYLRTYHPTDIYELDQTGSYRKIKDKGRGSALYSLALGAGYMLRKRGCVILTPFIRYQYSLQSPYADRDFADAEVKVFPHAALHVGSIIQIK